MHRVVHCKKEQFDVYIGRRHPDFPEGSKWGNPFKVGVDGNLDEVLWKYEIYVLLSPELLSSLGELEGKVLACWCKPGKRCHGDILVRLVDKFVARRSS